MSLYGIETADDCIKAIDELIAMANAAQDALDIDSPTARRAVTDLCLRLSRLLKNRAESAISRLV